MAASPRPYRILFVCMGNICRSPAAEMIFGALAAKRGRAAEFEIDSAGTISYHQGSSPDSRMAATLRRYGYACEGTARVVTRADLDAFDLIVPMDEENLAELQSLALTDAQREKIRPLASYYRRHRETRVPDPYYGGQQGFDRVVELLEDGCQSLLESIASPAP